MKTHLLFLMLACPVSAGLLTIEADDFPTGTNLTQSGYSIYAGSSFDDVFVWDAVPAGDELPLGEHVLGSEDYGFWGTDPSLVILFDQPADSISVDFAAYYNYAHPDCKTFIYGYNDQDNQILFLVKSSPQDTVKSNFHYQFEDFILSKIVVGANKRIIIDNVQANIIPEPSSFYLVLFGAVLIKKARLHCGIWLRRRVMKTINPANS